MKAKLICCLLAAAPVAAGAQSVEEAWAQQQAPVQEYWAGVHQQDALDQVRRDDAAKLDEMRGQFEERFAEEQAQENSQFREQGFPPPR